MAAGAVGVDVVFDDLMYTESAFHYPTKKKNLLSLVGKSRREGKGK